MKRTIEVEDLLTEHTESAIADVKDLLLSYLEDNPDTESLPDIGNDLNYSGSVHEIIDGAVPIYTRHIKTAWFLHGSELEEAYENAGCGSNPMENDGMSAIYFYIEEKVNEWYHNDAQDMFDAWKEKRDAGIALKEEATD